ncbi:SAF domain-containing protein [Catenulispora pinisilvae]|uniref:SAF domain-containing protein n=1 Tax=Catenulispora pinisilvae TaxID=2705253 RepID=UPI0018920A9C|nr:SAF domain-containing protein [Catenulispora pinisilvae]
MGFLLSKFAFPTQGTTRRTSSPAGTDTDEGGPTTRVRLADRIRIPYAVASVALVVTGAVTFTVASWQISGRAPVLSLAQPIAAGQVITENDVQIVNVGAASELGLVPSIDESKVIGHVAAMPLAAGTLLTTRMVGTADFPPAGEAVVGVGLKSGTFPPRLGVGDHVNVWPGPELAAVSPTSSTALATPLAADAVVTSIGASDSLGTTVTTLLVDAQAAPKIAQAPSLSVVEVSPNSAGQS